MIFEVFTDGSPLDVSNIDRLIMNTTLAAIENIDLQIDTISKELAKYG